MTSKRLSRLSATTQSQAEVFFIYHDVLSYFHAMIIRISNITMPKLVSIQTQYGIFSVDTERDGAVAHHLASGGHQKELIGLIGRLARPDAVFVDVGTHIGTISIPVAGKVAKVISFEPSPITFATLSRNISLNKVGNIQVIMKGLGKSPSHATLEPLYRGDSGSQTLSVGDGAIPITTLDVEVPRADIIKIDAQGTELEVLLGASKLIAGSRPLIIVEIDLSFLRQHGVGVGDLAAFFRTNGYRLFFVDDELFRVRWLWLATFLISPGAFLFGHHSTAFDILAVPDGREMPSHSWARLVARLARLNIADKIRRLKGK
jgi:FkbM family methyltransferase